MLQRWNSKQMTSGVALAKHVQERLLNFLCPTHFAVVNTLHNYPSPSFPLSITCYGLESALDLFFAAQL